MCCVTVVPDEFFDEEVESEKEFLDIAVLLSRGKSLRAMNSVKVLKVYCFMWKGLNLS